MNHPWLKIPLSDYENHMNWASVGQLPALNRLMAEQLARFPVSTVMILGVAGGNGLEHVDPSKIRRVYGVDVNPDYLATCTARHPRLRRVFRPVCADLNDPAACLPEAELVVADLLVEYIGCGCFAAALNKVKPLYVSCVIQKNGGAAFVSDSPYTYVFDGLAAVCQPIDETALTAALAELSYEKIYAGTVLLPGGKAFCRIDFQRK